VGPDRETRSTSTPAIPAQNYTAATGRVGARYFRDRVDHFIEIDGDGFVNRDPAGANLLRGGNAGAAGRINIGARTAVSGSAGVRYEPLLVGLAVAPPMPVDPSVPPASDVSAPRGDPQQLWLSTSVSAALARRWTPRQEAEFLITDWRWRPMDGPGFESVSQSVALRHVWNRTDRSQARFGYRYDRTEQTEQGGEVLLPTNVHNATAGWQYRRRLSPERSAVLTAEGGVAWTTFSSSGTASSGSNVGPVGSVTIELNVTEDWIIGGGVRREVGAIVGVTPEPFSTNSATLQLAGTVWRRLRLGASAYYSRGAGTGAEPGMLRTSTATAQLQYGFTYWCAVFTSYSYYQHRLQDVTTTAEGFRDVFGRHSLRVGLSLWLPLYGTF
jgi:hypothetical protein